MAKGILLGHKDMWPIFISNSDICDTGKGPTKSQRNCGVIMLFAIPNHEVLATR